MLDSSSTSSRQGQGWGALPASPGSLLRLTQGCRQVNSRRLDACIFPPFLVFTCQLSTLNSFTSPLLTPLKYMVMKLILCYLSATQITALPVLHAPFSISRTHPYPARAVSQTPNPMLSGAMFRSHIRASSDAVPRSIHQGPSLLCCLQFSLLTIPKNEYILITVF